MIPAPESVTRKLPVLVPLNFSEKAPLPSVEFVVVEVATEILPSRCPPFVADTIPENSETTGAGGVGGSVGAGGEDGVAGDEEPHAETKPQRTMASSRRIVRVSIVGPNRRRTLKLFGRMQIRAIVFHVEHSD